MRSGGRSLDWALQELSRRLARKKGAGVRVLPGQLVQQTGEEERGRERVERAREFLKVYSRDGQSGPFTQESIIKSATFPLRLKPAGK